MSSEVKTVLKDEVRYLWHCNYWDGPRSGVAVFEGKKVWFFLEKEGPVPPGEGYGPWHFLVVELSKEELEYEEYWHSEFQKYVSCNTEYDEEGTQVRKSLKPHSEWYRFYDRFSKEPERDYSQNKPLCRYIG